MITIDALVNKIKWDSREKPSEYSLFYIDRITKRMVEIKYKDIKRIEEGVLVLNRGGEETEIPLHRIREVRKKGEVMWKR
jgi:uncharacterized protein (UPF0248 family)